MPNRRAGTKTITLGAATTLLTWSTQQLAQANTTTGGIGLTIALVLFSAYQLAEETDHARELQSALESIPDDVLRDLAREGGDTVEDALNQNDTNEDGGD